MPSGLGCLCSARTEAVGHTSTARHAIISSSAFAGWRAKTLLSPRSTIRPGATWRAAAQLMHAVSMYQSPDAESGFLTGLDVADLKAHVDQCLALLLFHYFQRALERRQQLLRLAHALAVAAGSLNDMLEARRGLERRE